MIFFRGFEWKWYNFDSSPAISMVGGGFCGWGKRGGVGLVAVTSADVWPFGKMIRDTPSNELSGAHPRTDRQPVSMRRCERAREVLTICFSFMKRLMNEKNRSHACFFFHQGGSSFLNSLTNENHHMFLLRTFTPYYWIWRTTRIRSPQQVFHLVDHHGRRDQRHAGHDQRDRAGNAFPDVHNYCRRGRRGLQSDGRAGCR